MELDRRIKLIATLGASTTLVAFATGWVFDPSSDIYTAGALASAAAVVIFGVSWRVDRIPSITIVVATVLLTVPVARIVDRESTRIMSTVALVAISTIGVVLVKQHRQLYLGVVTVFLLVHTVLAGQAVATIPTVGVASGVCFLIGALVLMSAFDQTRRLHAERLDLLDMAPAFISEDDWTEAEQRVRDLGIDDPSELRAYLLERRDLVRDIVGSVRVIHHNPALVETFGLPAHGGRFNPDRVHDDSLGAFVEQLVSIVTDRPFHDYEYRTTTKTGHDIALALRSIVNRRHPGQTRVLLVAQDITDQQTSRLALERAIRMKDEFVASVSHELRTPLAGVVGLTSSVLEGDGLSPNDRELLEVVSEQAGEMARIIEDLLVASRGPEHPVAIELAEVDACNEVRTVASGRDVTVKADGTVAVMADAGRLRQILRNLVTNAARYGEPPVELSVTRRGHRVWIDVSDHGEPIPDEQRERIFKPFQSSASGKRHPGSVGLGLAVSQVLARRMGGDLTYLHDGKSIFRLDLPAHEDLEATE